MKRHSPKTQARSRLFEEIILKSWWVIVFFFICFFAYEQATNRKDQEVKLLQSKLTDLQKNIADTLHLKEYLLLQMASREDPEWIEMILIEELGLVPEGHTKVIFP